MPLGEFTLIERYFGQPAEAMLRSRGDVLLGIGDDAAVLGLPPGRQLVAALDSLVEGRHFPVGSAPRSIGHRALAVNLSDLAAMGAEPAWFLLALTVPAADESFLEPFARGVLELAAVHGVALVGGDTTAGPLSVSVQALGFIEPGQALRRGGGAPGDLLYVSGTPGDSTAGLKLAMQVEAGANLANAQRQYLLDRFHFPEPRVALGRALRGIASACIDVSDGLAADAGKLAAASGCGVTLEVERLPISASLRALAGEGAARLALGGGEDYELCFTVSRAQVPALEAAADNVKCQVTRIGKLDASGDVTVSEYGKRWDFDARGFDHFSSG